MLNFVVINDTHYIRRDCHRAGFAGRSGGVTERIDLERNYHFTRHHLPDVIQTIARSEPDFVIHTGDIVHGNCDDQAGAVHEMREAMGLLGELRVPVYCALGSHDGILGQDNDTPIREVVFPHLSKVLGGPLDRGYYCFEHDSCLIIVLDYCTFGRDIDQREFLTNTLAEAKHYRHVFVAAHPPLIPIGRPFFGDLDMSTALLNALVDHPVDAYFCGHTHNQVASLHQIGERWAAQFMGTVLGYDDRAPTLLTDVRPLLPPAGGLEYGWGYLEDSAPGWWQVRVDGTRVDVTWHVCGHGACGRVTWNSGERPEFTDRPQLVETTRGKLPATDQIDAVYLRAAGSGCRSHEHYKVELNSRSIGRLPHLEYFDCRQRLEIPREYWHLIGNDNRIRVTTADEPMAIGAFVLEVESDGHCVRTNVSDYYVNTDRWEAWGAVPVHAIEPGSQVQVELNFQHP